MNPPHPDQGLPRRHHHLVHLHLDPHHHHHVHIHLCCCHHHHHGADHLLAPAPPAHLPNNQLQHLGPVPFPGTYPSAAPPLPEPPRAAVREDVQDLDPEQRPLHAEEAEDDEEEPVFVLTDEWVEFFAKSEAKRRLAKQQQKGRK